MSILSPTASITRHTNTYNEQLDVTIKSPGFPVKVGQLHVTILHRCFPIAQKGQTLLYKMYCICLPHIHHRGDSTAHSSCSHFKILRMNGKTKSVRTAPQTSEFTTMIAHQMMPPPAAPSAPDTATPGCPRKPPKMTNRMKCTTLSGTFANRNDFITLIPFFLLQNR